MSDIWNSFFGAEQSDGAERSELTGCPYKILGVCDSATSEEIQRGYEAKLASCKQAYDLLIDSKKRDAYDRQKMEKKKLKRKSEQLESEQKSEKKKSRNDDEELKKMRKELGDLGGAGLFFGNDRWTHFGGARNEMREKEIKKVLKLLSLGEKKINLKEGEFRDFSEVIKK